MAATFFNEMVSHLFFNFMKVGSWKISHQQETMRSVDEVMFWPVQLARIFGYWPFVRLDGKYAFKWSGAGFWLTVSNFLMLIACLGMVGAHGESMFVPVGVELSHSSTESASLWSIVLIESIAVLLLLALTLAIRQELLSTWEIVSHASSDVRGEDNQNSALCVIRNPVSSARREINRALAVLLIFSLVRATVRLADVAYATFYRLEIWKACLCAAALFAWDLMYSMTTLWVLIVTGFICCLTMSCQMLRSQLRTSNEGIYAVGRPSQNHITFSHLENHVRLHKELCRTAEVMNEKLKVPLIAIFMLKIVILTLAIFFAVTGMDLSNGLLEYDAIVQFFTIIIDLLSFHYLCSSGTAFTLEVRRQLVLSLFITAY